ncbi:MAG: Holliday junction resolvase RuvX [Chloroflexi bacterium]|nr:Holliday junction resolvase RuvX [Chloroflexota bacterium]MCH8195734.1 Holliday junction resolvase RuvX [Chloroflexota bacterium]MCI0768717.1 Holliday junction resolvase RuvX [Chloroflexota bacterium]
MRVLAVDVGERNIGIAVSDPTGTFASPVAVVKSVGPNRDVARVIELAREQEAQQIVVGIPISLDGVRREQAQRVEAFCDRLRAHADIPVVTWDERLTTVEAERRMREAGLSSRKRRERRDSAAAAVILQAYLESLRFDSSPRPAC